MADGATVAAYSSGPLKKLKSNRCFLKCDNCRKRKIKCVYLTPNASKGDDCKSCRDAHFNCSGLRLFKDLPPRTSINESNNDSAMMHTPHASSNASMLPKLTTISPHTHFATTRMSLDNNVVNNRLSTDQLTLSMQSENSGRNNTILSRFTPGQTVNVDQYLEKLFGLSELIPYTQQRLSVLQMGTPSLYSPQFGQVVNGLDVTMNFLCKKYMSLVQRTYEAIYRVTNPDKEVYLRQLLEYVQPFNGHESIEIIRLWQAHENCAEEDTIETWCSRVLDNLIPMYDGKDHLLEADRLCRILMRLPSFSPSLESRVQEAIQRTAKRMQTVFRNLDLPPQYIPVPSSAHNIFPSEHLAMHWRQKHALENERKSGSLNNRRCDILGRTLPFIAVELDDVEMLRKLLQEDPTYITDRDAVGSTVTTVAASTGNLESFKFLIGENPECLNDMDGSSRSLLEIACDSNKKAIVLDLLERVIPPTIESLSGSSPLDAAIRQGNQDIVKLLQSYGATPAPAMSQDSTLGMPDFYSFSGDVI